METNNPQSTVSPDNKQQGNKSKLFTEAMLLAIASAGAYMFAFLYERGYSSFFGIPTQFINVSLVNLLIFGAIVIAFMNTSVLLFHSAFPFMRPKHPYLAFYVPRFGLIFFLLVLVPFVLFGWERKIYWLALFGVWMFFVFLYLGLPLIIHRGKGSWRDKFNAELQSGSQEVPNFINEVGGKLGFNNLGLIIGVLSMFSMLSGFAGESEALRQKQFLITNTVPAMAVLRIYGDNMICAPLDRSTHEIKKSFTILKVAEDPKLILSLENVGPLKPVDKLASENAIPTPSPNPTLEPSVSPTGTPVSEKPIAN